MQKGEVNIAEDGNDRLRRNFEIEMVNCLTTLYQLQGLLSV